MLTSYQVHIMFAWLNSGIDWETSEGRGESHVANCLREVRSQLLSALVVELKVDQPALRMESVV